MGCSSSKQVINDPPVSPPPPHSTTNYNNNQSKSTITNQNSAKNDNNNNNNNSNETAKSSSNGVIIKTTNTTSGGVSVSSSKNHQRSTAGPQPFVIPTTTTNHDVPIVPDSKTTTVTASPQQQQAPIIVSYPLSQSGGIGISSPKGKMKNTFSPKASPAAGNSSNSSYHQKKTLTWIGGAKNIMGGGGGGNKSTSTTIPTLPSVMVARPRSDTWENTTMMIHSSSQKQQQQQQYQQPIEINLSTYNEQQYRLGNGEEDDDGLPKIPLLTSLSNSTRQQQQQYLPTSVPKMVSSSAAIIPIPLQLHHTTTTIQDQWKLLWETQSPNLVDPADVPSVIDSLMDLIVNRLSSVQITFVLRRIRYVVNQMYDTNGTSSKLLGNNTTNHTKNNLKMAKKFMVVGDRTSSSSHHNTSTSNSTHGLFTMNHKQEELEKAKTLLRKNQLLSENLIRQILPKPYLSRHVVNNNPRTSVLLSNVTENIVTLMLSLSFSNADSYLWDRTVFAASAAAEIAQLEMDVNKKVKLTKNQQQQQPKDGTNTTKMGAAEQQQNYHHSFLMPKPSQVPTLDGQAEFPPGITVSAFSTIVSMGLASPLRLQKLQLLFYLCFEPDTLRTFLKYHPSGGMPLFLLEVGNDTVLSLASLTHYHYFGHAFLPTYVSSVSHGNQDTTTTPNEENENGNNNNNTYLKHRFIPSSSREPVTVSLERVQEIIHALLDIERENVHLFQQKQFDSYKAQQQQQSNNKQEGTSSSLFVGGDTRYRTENEYEQQQQRHNMNTNDSVDPSTMKNNVSTTYANVNGTAFTNGGGASSSRDAATTNKALNSSIHKMMGRKASLGNNMNELEVHGGGGENGVDTTILSSNLDHQPSNPLFTMTDVMKKIVTISDATTKNDDSDSNCIFYYPSDENSTLTPLDVSKENFYTGTHEFKKMKYAAATGNQNGGTGTTNPPSLSSKIDLTVEDFAIWADMTLDDLALNVVLHKLLGEGILSSPATERTIVTQKWLEWEGSIKRVMKVAKRNNNNNNTNTNNSNELNSMIDVGKNGKKKIINGFDNNSAAVVVESPEIENNDDDNPIQLSESMQILLSSNSLHSEYHESSNQALFRSGGNKHSHYIWGGLGSVDGGGGIGYGVLYCISKIWWDEWTAYTGWTFIDNDRMMSRKKRTQQLKGQQQDEYIYSYGEKRPGTLSNEHILEVDDDSIIRGSMGSFEVLKAGLIRGEHYVLVPPGVWDVLYELYGGGPPLPRMIRSPERQFSESDRSGSIGDLSVCAPIGGDGMSVDYMDDDVFDDKSVVLVDKFQLDEVEIIPTFALPKPARIPDGLSVTLNPWIIHVHLCDPMQPYRRGDAGLMSIRLMATPYQSLWRLYAEIISRFSFQSYKAFDPTSGRGKARLWKKLDPVISKEPVTRYGPWNLLCKSRFAILPITPSNNVYVNESNHTNYDNLVANWKEYADNASLETGGLGNHDYLMLEFAVQNKTGELSWPREAAAKAGRVRRLAEEDRKFRQLMQGVDDDGNLLFNPPTLVGIDVDAMDSKSRWYTVKILEVEIFDDDTDEEMDDDLSRGGKSAVQQQQQQQQQVVSRKKVKIQFHEHGGQTEWIDVESDRLAAAGRMASQADQDDVSLTSMNVNGTQNTNGSSTAGVDNKSKAIVTVKKTNNADPVDNTMLCSLPGFGACGLTNLGNTCYVNSALQCLSYLPILRSYLLSGMYLRTGDLNKDNPLGSGGKLIEETAELMRAMWSAKMGEKSPSKFRSALGKLNPQFSGGDQQDAQEFLNFIIDALHEDSCKPKKKPYVEPIEDEWVKITKLARVGEEAWRRYLRRNRSVMADVAMGQALNTVTCPVCNYSSRNFDPFNLLSIPIPTVADVLFQCTVYRRATARNCPWVLDKARRGSKKESRFDLEHPVNGDIRGPPSIYFVAEQYVIALSRLADSGDLRLQIQNLTGIRANYLRLCRAEDVVVNEMAPEGSVVRMQKKIIPLSDRDGPASQHEKKRGPNDDGKGRAAPTQIVAFEWTLNNRNPEQARSSENGDDDEEDEPTNNDFLPSPKMIVILEKYLHMYGNDFECRLVDTDSFVIAKAVSRSLWPRTEDELKLGLRVDAKDSKGNWYPGSVIEIVDDKGNGGDMIDGESKGQMKRARVHFDNFSTKWDEMYSIDNLLQGRVQPLYSHAVPKRKPTEFLVHHRHTDRQTGQLVTFGQSFYVQCQTEWSNARAGAHILAQVCRFMAYDPSLCRRGDDETDDMQPGELESKAQRLYEKTHSTISDLIDLLVNCDREYVRLALGKSEHNTEEEKSRPFRNPTFDASRLSTALVKKAAELLQRLPFEVKICSVEGAHSDKPSMNAEEVLFPFSLVRTIGNFMQVKHAVFLQWREPTLSDKRQTASAMPFRSLLTSPVMYAEPIIKMHESTVSLMRDDTSMNAKKNKVDPKSPATTSSAGIELSFCLEEFCKIQKLSLSDNWKCPVCKVHREGGQNMNLWRLPDLLTFHIKRFNMSARWHEKITTKVNFPLTGLDMRGFCHEESPVWVNDNGDNAIYDLIGVVNHYGSMTGGHYVATCKASACSKDGREEVAFSFNGSGASTFVPTGIEENDTDENSALNIASAWVRLPGTRGNKSQQESAHQGKNAAAIASRTAAESAEPLWLQFDDEVVEPIPPRYVVSEMAYVLFYRRRNISSSNIAKYSTLE